MHMQVHKNYASKKKQSGEGSEFHIKASITEKKNTLKRLEYFKADLLKIWCVRYLLVLLKGLPMIPFTRSPIFSAISSCKYSHIFNSRCLSLLAFY